MYCTHALLILFHYFCLHKHSSSVAIANMHHVCSTPITISYFNKGGGDFLFDSFPVIYNYIIQYIVIFYQQASLLVVLYLVLCDKTMYMDVCTVRTVCILYCRDRTTTHTHVRMHIHTYCSTNMLHVLWGSCPSPIHMCTVHVFL